MAFDYNLMLREQHGILEPMMRRFWISGFTSGCNNEDTHYQVIFDRLLEEEMPTLVFALTLQLKETLKDAQNKYDNLGFKAELEPERRRLADIINACRTLLRGKP